MSTATAAVLKIARGFSLPLDLVTEATGIVATRGAGKSSASAVIVEEAFALGVQSVIFDRTGVYWGLRSNADGDGPGLPIYVLGGPHGDVPLEAHAGVLIADLVVDSGHSFVLDLSDFSKGAAVKFAADFLERLYDRKARSRTTTLLVMDEAHFYAPQTPRGGFKGDSARLMGAMEDVVGLGRSRGLGVVLTTQRTQALNKAVLDLIETLLVMRMLSPRARLAVRQWIMEKHEDDEQGVIETLDSLPTGTAWVWSPLRGVLDRVALRRIKTFDSYATPKPGQAQVEPTARKQLDLDSLGEQMRATAERAKENDPTELRKRLREAERLAADAKDMGDVLAAVQEAAQSGGKDAVEMLVSVYTGVNSALDLPWSADVVDEIRATAVEPILTAEDRVFFERVLKAADAMADQAKILSDETTEKFNEMIAKMPEARSQGPRIAPAPPPRVPRPRPVAPTASAPADSDGSVSEPQQRVLDAVGWYEALGVYQPTRVQVALMAGYSAKSGGFANLLGKLSTAGHISYPGGGLVALTDSGRELATDPGLPSTNEGVQAGVLARLPAPQARLLSLLIAAHPNSMTREELAEAAGYSPTSGGFANLLGKLRTGALIGYPDRGHVVALDVLFPIR